MSEFCVTFGGVCWLECILLCVYVCLHVHLELDMYVYMLVPAWGLHLCRGGGISPYSWHL